MKAQYKSVGIDHNRGLAEILNGLKKNKNATSRADLFQTVRKKGRDFFNDLYGSNKQQEKAVDSFISEVARFEKSSVKITTSEYNPVNNVFSSDKISNKQKILLKKIMVAIEQNSNLSALNNDLKNINLEAENNLKNKKEIIPIIIATTVAKASAAYWNENIEEWEGVISNSIAKSNKVKGRSLNLETLSSGGPGELVESDVAGATAFSIAALYGCDEATLGACAAPAALTGATATSAADGVKQLWEAAVDWWNS